MKSIAVIFEANNLKIPLNYQYGLQSMIYNILRESDCSGDIWHDSAVCYGNRQYKLFTFSSLRGTKKIINGEIQFTNLIYLDIRSVRNDLCNALVVALSKDAKLTLLGQTLSVKSVKWCNPKIETNNIKIKMLSPLTIHRTEGNKTYYLNPLDQDFSEQINQNFIRKYQAFNEHEASGDIKITPLNIGVNDKYVTSFKESYITAWRGEYNLQGESEYLNFLYYSGLGSKNSSGFGMFEML